VVHPVDPAPYLSLSMLGSRIPSSDTRDISVSRAQELVAEALDQSTRPLRPAWCFATHGLRSHVQEILDTGLVDLSLVIAHADLHTSNTVHRHEPPITNDPILLLHIDREKEFIVISKPGSIVSYMAEPRRAAYAYTYLSTHPDWVFLLPLSVTCRPFGLAPSSLRDSGLAWSSR
jgi:hypothetical protein